MGIECLVSHTAQTYRYVQYVQYIPTAALMLSGKVQAGSHRELTHRHESNYEELLREYKGRPYHDVTSDKYENKANIHWLPCDQ